MHSSDIEDQVDEFWAARFRFVSDSEREMFERILAKGYPGSCVSPSEDVSVAAKQFVCWRDMDFLDHFFRELFPRFDSIRDRLPSRVRFLAYFCLSRRRFLKAAYRCLEPEDFLRMGFGKVPNYELLRTFVYEHIGQDRMKIVFDFIIQELTRLLAKQGIEFGKRVGVDAADVPALKHDPEAEYSGYYKEIGYKVDVVHDLDQETLPLGYALLHINDHEENVCHRP